MHWLSIINASIFLWLCVGIALRRRHMLHATMMTLGFAFDIALLLYVEFSSAAIEQTVAKPGPLLLVHVLLATAMLALYPFVIYSGGRVLAGGNTARHRKLALPFMVARLLVVVTAFMVAR